MMSKTSEKSLKGKHPTFVCHDLSVGKRKRNECKKRRGDKLTNCMIRWVRCLAAKYTKNPFVLCFCTIKNPSTKHKSQTQNV